MRPADASPALRPGEQGKRPLIALALFAVYVIWGSTYLAMHIALETIPPFLMAGPRFLLAGALLYTFLRLRGAPRPAAREWGAAAKVGILLLVGGNGLVAIAQRSVDSSVAAVVVATMPLWMALISSVRGQRPSAGEWVGLLIGFGGVIVLNLGGQMGHAGLAVVLLLLAPICWATGSVWSKSLPLPAGPMATAAEMLVGGGVMLALGLLHGDRLAHLPSTRSLLALGYLIVFGSIVAFSAYGYLLRATRPAIATSYAYVNPVLAVALGGLWGGEQVGLLTWGATAIVLTGVVILTRARQRAKG